jgi:hypothetical protein
MPSGVSRALNGDADVPVILQRYAEARMHGTNILSKDLPPEQRQCIEGLLGHHVSDNEMITIRARQKPSREQPTRKYRTRGSIWRQLEQLVQEQRAREAQTRPQPPPT